MKKKVIEYTDRWTVGGIEGYILNLIKNMNHEKYEVCIVAAQKETTLYDDELRKYGIEVCPILKEVQSNPIKRILLNQRAFRQFMKAAKPDVLHLHICQGIAMRYAKIAKQIGIKRVITHCHAADVGEGKRFFKILGHRIGKIIYRNYIDEKIACSDLAAQWLYGSKDLKGGTVRILNGIVPISKFRFSETDREELREKLSIKDEKVYLHIGSMNYPKNQKFLLDVYRALINIEPNSILIFIGSGELEQEIKDYAEQLGLKQHIVFIQKTREVEKYMSAADVFLLPSLSEGNPIVGIEAQASGLPCVFSDKITRMAKILESTIYLSLHETAEQWAEKIASLDIELRREKCSEEVFKKGYNIEKQIKEIMELYEK